MIYNKFGRSFSEIKVTRKEIVWVHRPFSYNFWNMLKIAGWSFSDGADFSKHLKRISGWRWH